MSDFTITTNNTPRDLLAYCDLTPKEQTDFDYIEEDDQFSYRLFRYKGNVYDANEFTACNTLLNSPELKGWHGYSGDSYFSGILIKYKGMDRVIVGRYTC